MTFLTLHTQKEIVFLFFLYQGQQVIVIRTHKGENDDEKNWYGISYVYFSVLALRFFFCVSICECGVAINKDKEKYRKENVIKIKVYA